MHSSLIVEVTDLRDRLVAELDALVESALRDDKTVLRNQSALRQRGEKIIVTWSGEGVDRRQGDEAYEGPERRGPYVVVFGDINEFKAFNTKHGHERADFAIREAGNQLKRIAEACEGEAFRRSGDEFVLLLPQTQVERLRGELDACFSDCQVYIEDEPDVFRMSFGFCVVEKNVTFADLLTRAETACEVAKRAGGGKLVDWTPELDVQRPRTLRTKCASCATTMTLSIPADVLGETFSCPVCAVRAPAVTPSELSDRLPVESIERATPVEAGVLE